MGLTNIQLYKIDKEGRPIEAMMATQEQAMQSGSDWVLGHIDESIHFPKWDKGNREWVNGEPDNEFLENEKNIKLKELSETCKKSIISGFKQVVEGNEYTFHYDIEDQQNFSDTMRLFENNMIESISWNAYSEDGKQRVVLEKSDFTKIYQDGIRFKTNCLATLNDKLYPLVNSAKTLEDLSQIYWKVNDLDNYMKIDNSRTIEKKTEKLEADNHRNANGLLELTNLILMGGF